MREFECARCHRRESFDEFDDWWAHPTGLAGIGANWGPFADGDVCPSCQTDQEGQELKRRLVFLVERAIRSRSTNDDDPSPAEAAIIELAMNLREEIASQTARDDTRETPWPADPSPSDTHHRLRVAITGAFLTGCPLQVDITDYRTFQTTLVSNLQQAYPGEGWTAGAGDSDAGTYASGGGFVTEVPLVLVCRDGSKPLKEALDGRNIAEYRQQARKTNGWKLVPRSVRIEIYDLGVGVIDGLFTMHVPKSVPLSEAANALKQAVLLRPDTPNGKLSAVTMAFRELSTETTCHFREVVREGPVAGSPKRPATRPLRPWPSNETGTGTERWGRLLWLHPVHLLAAASPRTRLADARHVAPVFSAAMDIPGGCFVPGIGWSVIATRDGRSGTALPMRLLHLQWAFIALYMEIDRGLLTILNELEITASPDGRRRRLPELEREAAKVFNSYTRVVQASARVDSTLAGLGGDEQAVWDKLTEVTKYDTLVEGVDRKLRALRHITERRVQEASAAQARRSTVSLGLLTTLGLVTLSIAAVGYFFGSLKEDVGTPVLRIAVFGGGILIAFALWWSVFWVRPKEPPSE